MMCAGAWIPAKAWLAQQLIARAWQQHRASNDPLALPPRPWPWADTWPVAELAVEGRLVPALFVLADSSGESLAFGPGHVASTAKPGSEGHVVIAGHRDTHFAFLDVLRPGDRLVLTTQWKRRTYIVETTRVIHESRTDLLEQTGHAELTLLTCYPFDAILPGGSLRYAVHASLVATRRLDQPSAR
jgi:sortase A